jgi:hypothetical protein
MASSDWDGLQGLSISFVMAYVLCILYNLLGLKVLRLDFDRYYALVERRHRDPTTVLVSRPFFLYARVRAIEHPGTFRAPNGNTVERRHFVISFDDGTQRRRTARSGTGA